MMLSSIDRSALTRNLHQGSAISSLMTCHREDVRMTWCRMQALWLGDDPARLCEGMRRFQHYSISCLV